MEEIEVEENIIPEETMENTPESNNLYLDAVLPIYMDVDTNHYF